MPVVPLADVSAKSPEYASLFADAASEVHSRRLVAGRADQHLGGDAEAGVQAADHLDRMRAIRRAYRWSGEGKNTLRTVGLYRLAFAATTRHGRRGAGAPGREVLPRGELVRRSCRRR